ncbi:hypothetical protein [Streptomyces sp. NPDC004042]|uniref:hypothetical protein n=1 Tax=Streptomyces sp. NPDC004042 TaxID=3154451 RepID=UPI0033A5B28C
MSSHGGGRPDGARHAPDTGASFDSLAGVNPQLALDIQHSAMKKFKQRVDELLTELDTSEAAPGKVGQDRLTRAQLGSADFKEAQFLYDSYAAVHDELENLSKALSAQIEGMGLAVHASRVGYANLDEDIKARMQAVNAEAERYYVVGRDPYVSRRTDDPASAAPAGSGDEEGL